MTALPAVQAILALPLGAAAALALLPDYRLSARLNVAASFATLAVACSLFVLPGFATPYLLIDDLNVVFVALNAFVGFTTSVFSASYIGHELETGRLTPRNLRFYHAMCQFLAFAMNLALTANNIGLMWAALEIATLTTVAMVGLYQTREAIEAAWKYFILASVAIALALFGTILIFMAARPALGEGGMIWTLLMRRAGEFDPALLDLAFVFLHARLWRQGRARAVARLAARRPRRGADADLGGAVGPVAQCRALYRAALQAGDRRQRPRRRAGAAAGDAGAASLLFAAFMLYRRRDVKRLFAFSSIEHMGLIVFAFGIGGPLANFAGLLHMTMHSLTKSAIFFTVGHIAQAKGSQRIADIRGLTVSQPWLGWALLAGVFAIAGLPPGGVFTSEFLVVSSTFARAPALALILVFGLLVAFGALLLHAQNMAFGEPGAAEPRSRASPAPIVAHLSLVLLAGIYPPPPVVAWFEHVAAMLR